MTKSDWQDLSWLIGGLAAFALFISGMLTGFDEESRTPIPGTECEIVEIHQNNVWFTPGESKTTTKVLCTTEIEKVDIGR